MKQQRKWDRLRRDFDSHGLPKVFLEVLKPTFVTLSYDKLLEKCVLGIT